MSKGMSCGVRSASARGEHFRLEQRARGDGVRRLYRLAAARHMPLVQQFFRRRTGDAERLRHEHVGARVRPFRRNGLTRHSRSVLLFSRRSVRRGNVALLYARIALHGAEVVVRLRRCRIQLGGGGEHFLFLLLFVHERTHERITIHKQERQNEHDRPHRDRDIRHVAVEVQKADVADGNVDEVAHGALDDAVEQGCPPRPP